MEKSLCHYCKKEYKTQSSLNVHVRDARLETHPEKKEAAEAKKVVQDAKAVPTSDLRLRLRLSLRLRPPTSGGKKEGGRGGEREGGEESREAKRGSPRASL